MLTNGELESHSPDGSFPLSETLEIGITGRPDQFIDEPSISAESDPSENSGPAIFRESMLQIIDQQITNQPAGIDQQSGSVHKNKKVLKNKRMMSIENQIEKTWFEIGTHKYSAVYYFDTASFHSSDPDRSSGKVICWAYAYPDGPRPKNKSPKFYNTKEINVHRNGQSGALSVPNIENLRVHLSHFFSTHEQLIIDPTASN